MKKLHVIAVMILLLGLSSCLSTVHPIFTEKDLVFDQKLIGNWKEKKDSLNGSVEITLATNKDLDEIPQLRKFAGKTYMIRVLSTSGEIESAYFGFMLKLGKNYYFDYFPAETPTLKTYDDFYKSHFVKLHTSYRIQITSPRSFQMQQLDENYLQNLIREKKIRIRHETRENGNFVVTASTEELQQYLLKYGDFPEAYKESSIYIKSN
ncbi:MAG TPA: hypothetical protein VGD17_19640 [Chitinophagaceae bacterium]